MQSQWDYGAGEPFGLDALAGLLPGKDQSRLPMDGSAVLPLPLPSVWKAPRRANAATGDVFGQVPPAASAEDIFAHLKPKKPAASKRAGPAASPLWDVLRSAGTGVRSGAEGMVGLPGDVAYGMRWLNDQAMQRLGFEARPDYVADKSLDITSGDVRGFTNAVIGPGYEPQTTGGEYARTIGEFLPGSLAGPGGLARKALTFGVAPGVASEAAGQAYEGTDNEPLARVLGALAGGTSASILAAPRIPPTVAQTQRREIVEAAGRQGIDMPAAAMPDAPVSRFFGAKLKEIPLAGSPLRDAAERTTEQLGTRMDEIVGGIGAPDKTAAAYSARDSLRDWAEDLSDDVVQQGYDAVDQLVDPAIRTPLSHTLRTVRAIQSEMAASTSTAANPALRLVTGAAGSRQGLTYEGLKQLRTDIGARMSGKITPEPGTSQPALKRLYGALTDDLGDAVANAGGPQARQVWERANDTAAAIAGQRESIARIIGIKGRASAEAVYSKILNLAADRHGDAGRLRQVRQVMDQAGTWDDFRASVIGRLGRDPSSPTRVFSGDRFLSHLGRLSEEGRDIIFGSAAPDIADLARISEQHRALARLGNPSGTGGVVSLGTGVGLFAASPVAAIGSFVGSYTLARLLARPASARKMVNWARARNGFMEGRTASSGQAFLEASRQLAAEIGKETGQDLDGVMDGLVNGRHGPGQSPFQHLMPTPR